MASTAAFRPTAQAGPHLPPSGRHRGARAQVPEHSIERRRGLQDVVHRAEQGVVGPVGQIGVLHGRLDEDDVRPPRRAHPLGGDGQHVGRRVDADDRATGPDAFLQLPEAQAGAAADVEHDVTAFERQQIDDPAAVAGEGAGAEVVVGGVGTVGR